MNRKTAATGSIFICLGIILGAMGAHLLKEVLAPKDLMTFETGVRYMIYNGLGLLILGLSGHEIPGLKWITRLIIWGIILFSGSVFLLSIQSLLGVSLKFLGPVTPLGGVLMIAGWGLLTKNLLLPKK